MDRGAIVIDRGYLDDSYNEGIAYFAVSLLSHITFNDSSDIPTLDDYFGNYAFEIDENFVNFRFDILNAGFKKFLSLFGSLLNRNNFSRLFDEYYEIILNETDENYFLSSAYTEKKEKHLIEYLVYGLKNYYDNSDILPEGNIDSLSKYNYNELKEKTLDYIEKLFDPEKIKIVLFSKYKFLISSKYMKYSFRDLTKMNKLEHKNIESDKYEIKELNKSQIFYIKINDYEPNYVKIKYFIEKIDNESYSELYFKSNYLNYIIDMLMENKEGSLYYLLTNSSNYNIKLIYAYYEVILKSKISFDIIFELNCLKNINDIIFITYQFMNKIIKEAIGKNLQIDRYKEVRDVCYQTIKYTEKTFNTIELAKNNAENIILTKYNPELYFYFWCVPWSDNIELIKNETQLYLSQLKPENSVIILGIRDRDKNKFTCNENSPFFLDCSYLNDTNNTNTTKYYDIQYVNYTFNPSDFEKELDKNNEINITHIKNSFLSSHNEKFINKIKKETNEFEELINNTNTLNKFYFKRNVNFFVPKVYITLNLFHLYLRPNNTDIYDKKCNYFKILEMFSAIQRKINDKLADAMRARNYIDFGQNENYLYINIFCYEDVAYKIMKEIKNIIYNIEWGSTDFKSNNEIYKNEAFDNFFMFDKNNIQEISRYYLYCKLKNNLFNKYEFFPEKFEEKNYSNCIGDIEDEYEYLKDFIINGTIYGFYTKEKAQKIYDLFDVEYTNFELIKKNVNINIKNPKDYLDWVINIDKLNNRKSEVNISKEIYNKNDSLNLGTRYFSLKEKLVNVSIFKALIDGAKTNYDSFLRSVEMFVYRDIYFELIFFHPDKNIIIPNNTIVNEEWSKRVNSCYIYDNPVDNIGNRYYYVRKNFLLYLVKQQTSFEQRAKDEITNYQNEGIILDPGKIYDEYQKEYKGKINDQELYNTIKYYRDIIFRQNVNILDVYTLGE